MMSDDSRTTSHGMGATVSLRRSRKPEITRAALNAAIDEYLAMGGGITKVHRTDVISATSKAFPENYHQGEDNGDIGVDDLSEYL
jgi:hypothetical protein